MMNNSILNQLQGFLNTPPLWQNKDLFELEQFELPEYNKFSDLDPNEAMPSLSTNFVLGKRVETFFEFVIRHSIRYKIIAANLQIHKNKITIGEIDFLVHDVQQKKDLHIEMVYKFYVYDPSFPKELERWIGPNRKDSLLQKVQKIKQDQLPLLFKPETRKTLSPYKINYDAITQLVCFKANLFVPKYYKHTIASVNAACIVGYWIYFKDLLPEEYGSFEFFAPKKQDWPCDPKAQEKWVSFSEITNEILEFNNQKRSPLIWCKKPEGQYERFFVVWWPDN